MRKKWKDIISRISEWIFSHLFTIIIILCAVTVIICSIGVAVQSAGW